jgi:monothiol glutaredoxin
VVWFSHWTAPVGRPNEIEPELAMEDKKPSPFRIAQPEASAAGASSSSADEASLPARDRVAGLVRSAPVFVFMKGNPTQPMCGFSANTVAMLNHLGVDYSTFDVLSDESIRSAAKEYAQWPTFPQVWVEGELIGGNDIVSEMFASGELAELLGARS